MSRPDRHGILAGDRDSKECVMPIKSIVVHLADDSCHLPRLRLAADLANRFDAHLNVVYAKERVDMPAGIVGRGASMAFIAVAEETEREHAAATRKEVEDVCAGLRSWEWHEAQGEVDKVVVKWAHLSDLVIAEQSPQTHLEDKIIPHMADHLVMLAGAPMLLVPDEWAGGSVGKQILVAWKNSREANGAVRSALPFLKQADKVMILAHTPDPIADPPGSDVARYLGYHGIDAEIVGASADGGNDILEVAATQGSDLIVMGAYAKTMRLGEFIALGTTGAVMRNTTVPVLMRH